LPFSLRRLSLRAARQANQAGAAILVQGSSCAFQSVNDYYRGTRAPKERAAREPASRAHAAAAPR